MPNKTLQERDERWELASRAANEGIWDWDLRSNKVYRSQCWFELFGYMLGELADSPWAWERLIHPEDIAHVIAARNNHLDGLAPRYYAEHRLLCKDGVYRWFLTRGQVIRDETGTPVRMIGFYTDISQTVEDRERLQRQNAALQILNAISLQAIASDEHDVTLTAILHRIRGFMAADKAYLRLYDPAADVMLTHSLAGIVGPTVREMRRGENLTGLVWESGEYQCIQNYAEWPGRTPTQDTVNIQTAFGVPLKFGREVVGVISIAYLSHREILEDEIDMMKQFAAIAALVARNRQMAIELQKKAPSQAAPEPPSSHYDRNEFLSALADGKPMPAREMAAQAKAFGLTAKSGYLAIVVRSDCADSSLIPAWTAPAEPQGFIFWPRDSSLYILDPRTPPTHERPEASERAEELRQQLAALFACPICCVGVGLHCAGLRDIAAGFRQAREALEAGGRLHPNRTVHHYLDIALLQVLSRQGDKAQVEALVTQTLGGLLAYDLQKKSHLLETLTAILNEPSLRAAGESLFIHKKTLLFRKARIEEILGESIDDATVRLNLSLALQLHGLNAGQ